MTSEKKLPPAALAGREKARKNHEAQVAKANREAAQAAEIHSKAEDRLGSSFRGSLDQHLDAWLAGLGEFPLSAFSRSVLFREPVNERDAIDCALGVTWWCRSRLDGPLLDPSADKGRTRRAGLFDEADPPAGVDREHWSVLLQASRPLAAQHGWLATDGDLASVGDAWDEEGLPGPINLVEIVESDSTLRAFRSSSPARLGRCLDALADRIHEAESITSALRDRASGHFLARLDSDMLRGLGLLDGGGRPTEVRRHLALWILDAARIDLDVQGLLLLHAGLVDLKKYTPLRPRRMGSHFRDCEKHARKFWAQRAQRTPATTPAALIGNLEWSAWAEHHGRSRAQKLVVATLEANEPVFGP